MFNIMSNRYFGLGDLDYFFRVLGFGSPEDEGYESDSSQRSSPPKTPQPQIRERPVWSHPHNGPLRIGGGYWYSHGQCDEGYESDTAQVAVEKNNVKFHLPVFSCECEQTWCSAACNAKYDELFHTLCWCKDNKKRLKSCLNCKICRLDLNHKYIETQYERKQRGFLVPKIVCAVYKRKGEMEPVQDCGTGQCGCVLCNNGNIDACVQKTSKRTGRVVAYSCSAKFFKNDYDWRVCEMCAKYGEWEDLKISIEIAEQDRLYQEEQQRRKAKGAERDRLELQKKQQQQRRKAEQDSYLSAIWKRSSDQTSNFFRIHS